LRHLPILEPIGGVHHAAHHLDAALGIGEGAGLFQKRAARQEDMGVIGGFVEEQVMHDHAVHRRQPRRHLMRIGVDCRMSSPWM
jgi:hypothetical protein